MPDDNWSYRVRVRPTPYEAHATLYFGRFALCSPQRVSKTFQKVALVFGFSRKRLTDYQRALLVQRWAVRSQRGAQSARQTTVLFHMDSVKHLKLPLH